MRKIIITTTKIVQVLDIPDISEGRMQAIKKRQAEFAKLMAKQKRLKAWWETRRKNLELKAGTHEENKVNVLQVKKGGEDYETGKS